MEPQTYVIEMNMKLNRLFLYYCRGYSVLINLFDKGLLTDPALVSRARLCFHHVWRVHSNVEAKYESHAVSLVLYKENNNNLLIGITML